MVDTGRVISTAIQFIDGFTNPSRQVIDQMKKMGGEAVKAGNQIKRAGKTIAGAGSALTKSVTMPIAGVATAAFKMSSDFENSMAKVSTIADTSAVPMEALKNQVIELSNAVGVGVSDIAEAQYQAISAGVDTASSVDFVSVAVKAAKGGFTDTSTAVDGLTTVLNAYGMEANRATDISDQMLMAQNYGKTSFGEMASSMGKVIPIASSLSVSTEDLFGSIAVLTKNGIGTSEAVTGLKAAYSNILKPSADAGKTAKQLGMDFSAAHLQSVGWAKFLDEIKQKTGGNTETMAKLFGSTEALNSVTVLAGKGSTDFAEALKLMGDAGGSTEAAYQKMLTPTERMHMSLNKIKNSLIQFGVALTPAFEKAAEIIGKVGDRLNGLSEGQVNSIVKFAGIAAAIGPALMAFGKVVTTVGSVKRAFGAVQRTIGTFGGVIGAITSPAGIVIGVLAAIALAAALIIKNWDQVKGFLSNVGSWFKGAFDAAGVSVEDFKNVFSSIGETVGKIGDTIGGFVGGISDMFRKKFGPYVSEGAKAAGKGMQDGAAEVIGGAFAVAQAAEDGIQTFAALLDFFGGAFRGDWDNAARGFRDSVKTIFPPDTADKFLAAFDGFLPGIEGIVEGVKKALGGCAQDAKKIFGNFKDVFKGAGEFISGIFSGDVDQALGGFKKAAESGLDAAGNIFRAKIGVIKNFVTGALSKFLPESAVSAIEGVFDMVASRWDVAIGAAKGCVDGFVDAVKPLLENVKTVFEGLGRFVQGAFAGDWKGALEGLKKATGGALGGMANIVKAPFKMIGGAVKGAIENFKGFNAAKGIFGSLKGAVGNAFRSCGVDTEKFGKKMSGMKEKAESIMGGLKTIFGTVKDAAGKAFGFIGDVIQKAMAVAVPVVKVAFSAIGGAVAAAVHNISSVIDGLLTVIDGIVTFVSGVFTGNWKQAWEGVKDIFGGIFETFAALCKTPINAVIGIINGAINGINSISVTIPEWVPEVGGQAFGINIPTIPMLYRGTDNWKGGMAMIHDRGGEIVDLPRGSRVYPHDKSVEMARKEGERQGPGSVTVNIQKLADRIEVRSEEDIDRIAEALAYKLKKVAFNTGAA